VGSLPVVGHNVGFDLGFLRGQGLLVENVGLDTWELATILLPGQPGYSLGSLATRFGLELSAHRAPADAYATGRLFLELCGRAARLPRATLLEINRLARDSGWPLAPIFAEALATGGVIRLPAEAIPLEQLAAGSLLLQPLRAAEPLLPRETFEPVDVAGLAAMLAPDGAVARIFPGYEHRPPQITMLEAVAQAFNQQHQLMVEAGTGTGKSLAYLLPAIAYAIKNHTRIVVSTNTINLQDQLFNKDLPDLQRILGDGPGQSPPFRATLLKGRSNYICPRRFAALKSRPALSLDELRVIARILVWLPTTRTGDQSELSLPQPADRFVWSQVSAENEGCTLDRCQREQGGRCFYYRARKQAEAAHVIVVNHSLLMADAATENRVLPEYHHLIVDEAHHLEDAVTDQLSFRADSQLVGQLLGALHPRGGQSVAGGGTRGSGRGRSPGLADSGSAPKGGLLADVLACIRASIPEELYALICDQVMRLQADVEATYTRLIDFWEVLGEVMRTLQPQAENGEYDVRVRITAGVRSQPVWVEIEVSWENLGNVWQTLCRRLQTLYGGLQDLRDGGFNPKGLETLMEELDAATRRLSEHHAQMEAWVFKPNPNGVYWAEVNANDRRITLRAAPLHIGPLVQEHVLFRNETVILTSATLRTAGTFDYVRDRLHAYDADTIAVGSPFDYKESTLLYLPTDLPEPTAPGYQTAVEQALISLARALKGRTLALFTSNAQLRRTAQAVGPALAAAGIATLSQAGGGSRHQLLETFKTTANTVLLGTRSFWEGVDVVGPALSALVLVRLPFAVPTDPIVAARSETFDDPFYNYSVPDAILRFRQGFGRLIRSKTDRGVVVVLDKRVQSKSYGQLFLESLPECTVHRGPLMNLPSAAQRWVDKM
jgi:DNA polymerase-3 subunit epsilon/ATP-dependent DNA helicase DinG